MFYWEDEGMILGYLEQYPDYMTQAESVEELEDNLRDIYKEFTSGIHPRKTWELKIENWE